MRYYIEIDEKKIKEIYPEIENPIEHIVNMFSYFRYHNKNLNYNQCCFMEECNLITYSHGKYYTLGKELGKFGFSVKK